jgi:hypothetical protein
MDYEFNPGEVVTAVNRSSEPVTWRFNGLEYTLKPHERRPMNITYVFAGIRQNPVMGTYDPGFEHQHVALIGIAEMEDRWPCTPLEQSANPEAFDRAKLPEDRQKAFVQRVGWESDLQQLAGRNPLSADSGFAGVMPEK